MNIRKIEFAAACIAGFALIICAPAAAQISVKRTTGYGFNNSSIPNFMPPTVGRQKLAVQVAGLTDASKSPVT